MYKDSLETKTDEVDMTSHKYTNQSDYNMSHMPVATQQSQIPRPAVHAAQPLQPASSQTPFPQNPTTSHPHLTTLYTDSLDQPNHNPPLFPNMVTHGPVLGTQYTQITVPTQITNQSDRKTASAGPLAGHRFGIRIEEQDETE